MNSAFLCLALFLVIGSVSGIITHKPWEVHHTNKLADVHFFTDAQCTHHAGSVSNKVDSVYDVFNNENFSFNCTKSFSQKGYASAQLTCLVDNYHLDDYKVNLGLFQSSPDCSKTLIKANPKSTSDALLQAGAGFADGIMGACIPIRPYFDFHKATQNGKFHVPTPTGYVKVHCPKPVINTPGGKLNEIIKLNEAELDEVQEENLVKDNHHHQKHHNAHIEVEVEVSA